MGMAEPDTSELDALLDSLNGSAERFQTLWFSFLGLALYLAIAALATTHRTLLLGESQILPILNIKLELLPFYVIAPLIYLVFHFYLLMMLALLARTAAAFDKQLRTTLTDEADHERYRARVENALFLHDPDVARGLIRNGRLAALGDQLETVRTRMKYGREGSDACEGLASFTRDDWLRLDAIKPVETIPSPNTSRQ
jgi:hypothetical protein